MLRDTQLWVDLHKPSEVDKKKNTLPAVKAVKIGLGKFQMVYIGLKNVKRSTLSCHSKAEISNPVNKPLASVRRILSDNIVLNIPLGPGNENTIDLLSEYNHL